jgi:ATP-dependent protease ClpP protease subunit
MKARGARMADDLNKDTLNANDVIQCVIETTNEYIINIDDDVKSPNNYRHIIHALRSAKEEDKIRLIINTCGGYIDTAIQLIEYIWKCKATVIAEIYQASSAGSLISLACDEIQVSTFGYMMIHSISGGDYGKIHERKASVEFTDKWCNKICGDMYKGFLTVEELNHVLNGKDYYFHKAEIDKRLKKWKPHKSKKSCLQK